MKQDMYGGHATRGRHIFMLSIFSVVAKQLLNL
jgi:hypothetical protein